MGVSKIVTVKCDYPGCNAGGKGPAVVSWCATDVEAGRATPPEEAKYLVLFQQTGTSGAITTFSFCCQLHAAEYFLPPGYEAKQKQVIELPKAPVEPVEKWVPKPEEKTWMDEPPRSENELSQADGWTPLEEK